MSFFSGGLGAIVGSVGQLAGGMLDAHYNREAARMNQAFQREVFQNQLQWKAQDAKKAGLHPLAALGGGSYSGSPVSSGGTDFSGALGKLGQGIGDATAAYLTKDELAAKAAKADQQQDEQHQANLRESAARTLMYNGQALEATRRAASYSVPMASGLESIPGQVDARPSKSYMEDINKFAWPRNPDGTYGDPIPSSEFREIYEDVPFLEYLPFADAAYHKWRSIFTGTPVDGRYHDWRNNNWTRKRPPKHPFFRW